MKTFEEKAAEFGMTTAELAAKCFAEERIKNFIERNMVNGNLNYNAEKAIEECMAKFGAKPKPVENPNPWDKKDNAENIPENVQKGENEDLESEVEDSATSEEKDENEENTESEDKEPKKEPKKTRKTKEITVDSDIENVDAVELRKFLMDNFSIKPEKMCFMSDLDVVEKVSERYIAIERENDFIMLKRNTNILSIKK